MKKNHEAYQPLVKKKTQKTQKLRKEFLAQQLIFKKSNQESQASTHANYVVAYEIAKQGKPHLKGESPSLKCSFWNKNISNII